ncbi:XRE family transcriptional regulator [Streptomyces sp. NPDC048155]|uniref:XRE family transcriptional regulator n=1 Tax=Streptomyces sp. NPDC048155 TaxID=3154818 RepID=UPI0033DC5CD6
MPGRLLLARQRRALTLNQLAGLSKITSTSLNAYENERQQPSRGSISSLSAALGFPVSFFSAPAPAPIQQGWANLRRPSKLASRQRDGALSSATLAASLNPWLESRFHLPQPNVPRLQGGSPEEAAEAVRTHWYLADAPIQGLVPLLEANGIRVFSLPLEFTDVGSFSAVHSGTPFIFLTSQRPDADNRLDAARALGHLVLRPSTGQIDWRAFETETDRFAAAFLMPRTGLLAHMLRNATPERIATAKGLWGVPATALAHRLHGLGLTQEWNFRRALAQVKQTSLSRQDRATSETSALLPNVFKALQAQGLTPHDVAEHLCLPMWELNNYMPGFDLLAFAPPSAGAIRSQSATWSRTVALTP